MKEQEIRPDALLNRYLELSAQDAQNFFRGTSRIDVPCVACGSGQHIQQFVKNGFSYAKCVDCGSLFQSPRPSIAALRYFICNQNLPVIGLRFFIQQLLRFVVKKSFGQEFSD